MDIVFLLIPLSVVLVFLIALVFWYAVHSGQFEDLEREGERLLEDEMSRAGLDRRQAQAAALQRDSNPTSRNDT